MDNFLESLNDSAAQSTFEPESIQKNKWAAVIGYVIPILFFIPFCMDQKSNYCKFHSNQQFAWFIISTVLGVASGVIGLIPIVGLICTALISLATLAVMVVFIIGVVKDKALRIPGIGSALEIFK